MRSRVLGWEGSWRGVSDWGDADTRAHMQTHVCAHTCTCLWANTHTSVWLNLLYLSALGLSSLGGLGCGLWGRNTWTLDHENELCPLGRSVTPRLLGPLRSRVLGDAMTAGKRAPSTD